MRIFELFLFSTMFCLLQTSGSSQNRVRSLKNCVSYSKSVDHGIQLEIDTFISNTAKLIFWNLTDSVVWANSYFSTLEIELQYLAENEIWKSNDYGDWCGTGYDISFAKPYSFTRVNYSLNHIAGNEKHRIRFYANVNDTLIYSKEVMFAIDPLKIRSQDDRYIDLVNKVLDKADISISEKQNLLFQKGQTLCQLGQYKECFKILEDLTFDYKFSDKVKYKYSNLLLKYQQESTLTKSQTYVLFCKCIELLNSISISYSKKKGI